MSDDATRTWNASGEPDLAALRTTLGGGRPAEVVRALAGADEQGNSPASPSALVLLADARLALGDTAGAVSAARRAVAAAGPDPGAAAASAGAALASALCRRGDAPSLAEARAVLRPLAAGACGRHDAVAARVLHADGALKIREGALEEARVSLLDALAGAHASRDAWRASMVHDSLGMLQMRLGDPFRALHHYDESLREKQVLGDLAGQAITHGNRARLYLSEGRADSAVAEFDADLALARRAGDGFGEVVALNGRGTALLELRRFDEADAALEESLRLAEQGGHAKQAGFALKDLAILSERRGRIDEAIERAGAAVARFEAMGNSEAAGFTRTVLGRILFRADRVPAARANLERAVRDLRGASRRDLLADALVRLAESSPDDPAAPQWLDEAEQIARAEFRRDLARDVAGVRDRVARRADARRIVTGRNTIGFGRDRREFHLIDRLGKGAQGETWRALDVGLGRLVVVKRLPIPDETEDDRSRVASALHEFEAAMRIDHPGIVRVHGVERVGAELLLAMEHLPGPSLYTRIAGGPPPADDAWSWIRDLAAAVDALHAAGIVHRDLKPDNVVFGAAGRPVIIDFGLARLSERPDALAGRVAGTPGYGAPEQWLRRPIDHRADLFALGVIAIEILTGSNFLLTLGGVKTVGEWMALMGTPSRIAELAAQVAWPAHVPPSAQAALRRLVDADPAMRPRSAREAVGVGGA